MWLQNFEHWHAQATICFMNIPSFPPPLGCWVMVRLCQSCRELSRRPFPFDSGAPVEWVEGFGPTYHEGTPDWQVTETNLQLFFLDHFWGAGASTKIMSYSFVNINQQMSILVL